MSVLKVLYQSDDNYAIFMGVSICSLLENNKAADEIKIYIIDDSISMKHKDEIRKMVHSYQREVLFVAADSILENTDICETFAYAGMRKNSHSYLKLFADQLLPDVEGRIVYIDCDTAILGDLSPLMDMDMQEYRIGMVLDSLVIDSRCSVGMKADDNYYNSGVILMDLDKWRNDNYSKRILNHAKHVRLYGTVDQDILNMEFLHEIYTLPIAYNLQPLHLVYPYKLYSSVYRHKEPYYSEKEINKAVDAPKIVHYLRYMGMSPWHLNNVHPGTVYFDHYLSMSPWADFKKPLKKMTFLFKLENFMYQYLPKAVFLHVFFRVHEAMLEKSNLSKRG